MLINYGLCSSHYLSESGLTRDAMLKMTKIDLELIADSGTRGDICYIFNRYSEPNKKIFWPKIRIKIYYLQTCKWVYMVIKLCKLHNDYPLASDKVEIKERKSVVQMPTNYCWFLYYSYW